MDIVMYQGVETAQDMIVNANAQSLAHEEKTGKTIHSYARMSTHSAACWRTWTSLSSDERIAYINKAAQND